MFWRICFYFSLSIFEIFLIALFYEDPSVLRKLTTAESYSGLFTQTCRLDYLNKQPI